MATNESYRDDIHRVLAAESPLRCSVISKRIGKEATSVQNVLGKMVDQGLIQKFDTSNGTVYGPMSPSSPDPVRSRSSYNQLLVSQGSTRRDILQQLLDIEDKIERLESDRHSLLAQLQLP